MPEEEPKPKRMGRPPKPGGAAGPAIYVRGSTAWRAWVLALAARHTRGDVSALVERALAEFAEREGDPKPPER